MDYRITINNEIYILPKRTVDISEKLDTLIAVRDNLENSAEKRITAMYEFISSVLGVGKTKSILGSNISKCDYNEVWIIAQSIIDVYNSPIKRYEAQKKAEDLARSPLGKLMAQKNA